LIKLSIGKENAPFELRMGIEKEKSFVVAAM